MNTGSMDTSPPFVVIHCCFNDKLITGDNGDNGKKKKSHGEFFFHLATLVHNEVLCWQLFLTLSTQLTSDFCLITEIGGSRGRSMLVCTWHK